MIILLLFLFLLLNIKKNDLIVKLAFVISFSIFIVTIIFSNFSYVKYCIYYLFKSIMNYIYFPSTVIYFLIVIISLILVLISIFSEMDYYKRVLDISFFSVIYFLFFNFIAVVCEYKLDLADKVSLYTNNISLSIIQITNLVFVIWVLVILFYKLYNYFKNKYDKKD